VIKPFLLDQKRIAGIGNVYVQDPLFKAGIHLLRSIQTLSDDEVAGLWRALWETLQESVDHGDSAWELNCTARRGGSGSCWRAAGRESRARRAGQRWRRSRRGARAATCVQCVSR
jgi:formamidopyrimidine-DNA glycosylase